LGQLHSNLGEVKNVSINWINWINFHKLETFGQIPTALIIFGKLKQLHSNLGTIRAIWANWKSVIQIYIIYKYLSK